LKFISTFTSTAIGLSCNIAGLNLYFFTASTAFNQHVHRGRQIVAPAHVAEATTLQFVIPTEVEGSAVPASFKQNCHAACPGLPWD
jgi:hypothetical protein